MTRIWLLVEYMTFRSKPAAILSLSCIKHHAHQHLPRSAFLRIFYLRNHEIVVENLCNIIIRTVVWGKENKYILFYSILTQVCSWIASSRNAKTKVETANLRNRKIMHRNQCCGSGSGIRDPRETGWVKSQEPDPGSGMNNQDHIS